MSLLVDLSAQALDPAYAAAAARRDAEDPGRPAGGRRPPALLAAGVLVATLLIVVAALQAHGRAPAAAQARSGLLRDVQRESASVAALSRQVDDLRRLTARLRDTALSGSAAGTALARRVRAIELAAGVVAVRGPGLRVVLDDAPGSGSGRNRVQDRDLQAVVNALWAAGAEAVAVNGERLTALSAIRQAGDAILVDFQPLRAPYTVLAIGDPVGLATGFGASPTAARMKGYVQLYGLRFGFARAEALSLPAAAGESLHFAHPIPSPSRGGSR